LLGSDEHEVDGPPADRVVRRALAVRNRAPAPRRERYLIPAEEVRRVERVTRAGRDRVVGFFHSHPDRAARPSRLDAQEAWPRFTYLILSVVRGRAEAARAFELDAEGRTLRPVAHRVEPHARFGAV
jgi:proteasome lid subunit RPN8/RPN11